MTIYYNLSLVSIDIPHVYGLPIRHSSEKKKSIKSLLKKRKKDRQKQKQKQKKGTKCHCLQQIVPTSEKFSSTKANHISSMSIFINYIQVFAINQSFQNGLKHYKHSLHLKQLISLNKMCHLPTKSIHTKQNSMRR